MVLLKGQKEVLRHAELLEDLALRCHQPAAMGWLKHFVLDPNSRRKMPYLALFLHGPENPATLEAKDVRAAVLLFEYQIFGLATGVFSTDDASGWRTLIAVPADRAEVAQRTAEALLQCGAQVALVTYDSSFRAPEAEFSVAADVLWAARRRPMTRALSLAETFEKTLATLGKSTRFNLGYYRRRLLAATGCEFIADATAAVGEQDLIALSLHPDDKAEIDDFKLRWRSSRTLPGSFLSGLRARDGKWLGLVGGWRQGTTTVLQWQMNAGGYGKHSVGTALRSFFLESEVLRGTRSVVFYSGTSHSIKNSFVQGEVTDLIVQRRSWRAVCLRLVARIFARPHRLTGPANFLARALTNDGLQWHQSRPPVGGMRRVGSSVGSGLK